MAIIGPDNLGYLQINSDVIKKYIMSMLGFPQVAVEISEDQFESIFRTATDFISQYMSHVDKIGVFYTQPLQTDYKLPCDAWHVTECAWDNLSTRIDNVFGAEAYLWNIGSVASVQTMLLDYTLLQQYRRFSTRILGNEGHWDIINDGNNNLRIRLAPVPKGIFPVVVIYTPIITQWKTGSNRKIIMDYCLAEAMIALGNARAKKAIPSPDGSSVTFDSAIRDKGWELREKVIEEAQKLSVDPQASGIYRY